MRFLLTLVFVTTACVARAEFGCLYWWNETTRCWDINEAPCEGPVTFDSTELIASCSVDTFTEFGEDSAATWNDAASFIPDDLTTVFSWMVESQDATVEYECSVEGNCNAEVPAQIQEQLESAGLTPGPSDYRCLKEVMYTDYAWAMEMDTTPVL
ncbi:hypothetical protein FYK55_28580, partial [Roseiconus nitratireducens]